MQETGDGVVLQLKPCAAALAGLPPALEAFTLLFCIIGSLVRLKQVF